MISGRSPDLPFPDDRRAPAARAAVSRAVTYIMWRVAAAGLAACLSLAGVPAAAQAADPARLYVVDSKASVLKVFVGRAGLLSGMGHDHVVVSRSLGGEFHLAAKAASSHARLELPVHDLVVDEPGEMRQAGHDAAPPESARTGTRRNMLGPAVLDAEQYPRVTADVTVARLEDGRGDFKVTLDFRDRRIDLQLPATLSVTADRLRVDAAFSLDHAQLGLEPYSVMGGMLRVARAIEFELHVEANRPR